MSLIYCGEDKLLVICSIIYHHQCSAQGLALHCKLRHQGYNSAQRQELRNLGCSFTRDK